MQPHETPFCKADQRIFKKLSSFAALRIFCGVRPAQAALVVAGWPSCPSWGWFIPKKA